LAPIIVVFAGLEHFLLSNGRRSLRGFSIRGFERGWGVVLGFFFEDCDDDDDDDDDDEGLLRIVGWLVGWLTDGRYDGRELVA